MREITLKVSRHFLFNGLNCSISLCRKSPKDAANCLIALSECLIYGSNSDGFDKWVSMEEEVDYIKSYLTVQKYRFAEKLIVDIDEDKWKSDNIKVPKFLLVSVMEPIIKLGLAYNRKGIHIKLSFNNNDKNGLVVIDVDRNLKALELEDCYKHIKKILKEQEQVLSIEYGQESTTCISITI